VPESARKRRLQEALAAAATNGPATAYLSGHLVPARERGLADPLATGLRLIDDDALAESAYLTVSDLLTGGSTGVAMPDRVLILACSSTGVIIANDGPTNDDAGGDSRWPLGGEWTGFGAACLVAGARTAVCTQFDQLDIPQATALDHQIARMLQHVDDAVKGLAAIQRQCLAEWRAGGDDRPAIVPMCYSIIVR
jgi:hypothetical protein